MNQSRFAGEPITDEDGAIAAALEEVSVPALIMSMVHMTGDPSWIRGEDVPVGIYLNEVQGFMDPESQARVRARALDAIVAYRDGGCVLPPDQPDDDLLAEMMDVLVGGEVPREYLPLITEELELDGVDARRVDIEPAGDASDTHVVVIGAGMSGILAAIRLDEAGIPFTVFEKNEGLGGTWWENRYPGCRVDVGNHFYCYSFEPDDGWTEFFARAPELAAYFDDTARRHGLMDRIRTSTEVVSATWDDPEGTWDVEVRGPDGSTEHLRATAVISAVGQLNRPKRPDIDGIDDFEGVVTHTAQWPDDLSVSGRRVAVIGTGASSFQLVPAIAGDAEHVTVFQRSAPWMFPNPHYHDTVGDGVRWALRHLPYYGRWYRFLLFWPACDGGLPAMRIDPDYPHQDRAVSEVNDAARAMFTEWIVSQCEGDDELAAKVVPDYVCLGTRTLQDNGSWLGALRRDDVDLVTDPIARVAPGGVVTTGGDGTETLHEADVLVLATGFHANRYLWPMHIVGRDGAVLSEQWGDEPTALYGVTVPNFPNLFCIYGPGTNLASGGSMIFHSECEVRYAMGCLKLLLEDPDVRSIEVTPEAHDDYNERLQAELDTLVWSHPSIKHSWYRNRSGRIRILSPWRLVDFWSWTRRPDLSHYTLR